MKNIYILHCDTDGQTHGCFDDASKVIPVVKDMIKNQPFHIECDVNDFYLIEHKLNSTAAEVLIGMETLIN